MAPKVTKKASKLCDKSRKRWAKILSQATGRELSAVQVKTNVKNETIEIYVTTVEGVCYRPYFDTAEPDLIDQIDRECQGAWDFLIEMAARKIYWADERRWKPAPCPTGKCGSTKCATPKKTKKGG